VKGSRERKTRRQTLASDLAAELRRAAEEAKAAQGGPLVGWQADPVGYVVERLGVARERVMPHQRDFLESLVAHEKTALRTGTKTGKTRALIWAALWFYECFSGARVVMTATKDDQVRGTLWKELREVLRTSKHPIEGKWSDNPKTGFRAADGREIIAIGARDIEGVAGISGPAQLFLVDEASHLPTSKAEAIEGNMAGAGMQRMAWTGNPVRAEGPFYEAFHNKREFWNPFHVSSETVAEWHARQTFQLPGVVSRSRLERWKEEYGEESPFYVVRVRGDFLLNETGRVISMERILEAQERWALAEEPDGLSIGLDPAGAGGKGDDSVFALVRGGKLLALYPFRGLDDDGHLVQLRAIMGTHRRPGEAVRVVIDSEGPIGGSCFAKIRAVAQNISDKRPADAFEVLGVKASDKAHHPHYDRRRDEVWASLAAWLPRRASDGMWTGDGGAIPPDAKLAQELYAPNWVGLVTGKQKVMSNDDIREVLGRSPDRASALALAVWTPPTWQPRQDDERPAVDPWVAAYGGSFARGESMDIHNSNEWWSRR
jgi:phage terminase large subunit